MASNFSPDTLKAFYQKNKFCFKDLEILNNKKKDCTSFMTENSNLHERYILAKEAGFKAAECAFPYDYTPEQISHAKTKTGIEQILINSYPGDWDGGERGFAAIPGKEVEFRQSLMKSIEYANKLNCKRIHIMSGSIDEETPINMEIYKSNLKMAISILEKHDITGLIEPINKYTMPKYFLNSYEKALSVIQNVNSKYLKLQLDIFHLQQICGNLSRNITDFMQFVDHIQIAQVPYRNEPDSPGEIDYKYIFKVLNDLGYNGWIGLEYSPKNGTKKGLTWISKFGYTL